jgi:cystathionine beta-lyase
MMEPSLRDLRNRAGKKWRRYEGDVIPAWVADMDYPPDPLIVETLQTFLAGGDWGYVDASDRRRLIEAGVAWSRERQGWEPSTTHSRVVLDVMQGVAAAIMAFTRPGDGVIITNPVYHPFGWAIESSGRTIVDAPLTARDDGFRLTKPALEGAVERGGRLLLLCNPHNPTGRVFTAAELKAVAEVALDTNLLVVSDEIHADLVYEPHRHIPLAALGSAISERTITITSPSKAFNLAGVGCALACFGTDELARRFDDLPFALLGHPTATGLRAATAAWELGLPWLDEIRSRLAANRATLATWAAEDHMIGYRSPEATYLAWMDFRPQGWPVEPHEYLLTEARVALSSGIQFGNGGQGHARLNFGTYPWVLDEMLGRLDAALKRSRSVL